MLSAIIFISLLPITVIAETYTPTTVDYYNGHTYAVYDVYLTWSEAKDYCEKIGGHLVTITSEQEQNNIQLLLDDSLMPMYWLGGEKKTSWRWITGESFNYTCWDIGEPNNIYSAENVLMIYGGRQKNNDYTWNDTINNHSNTYYKGQFGFICEWDYMPDFDINKYRADFILNSGWEETLENTVSGQV